MIASYALEIRQQFDGGARVLLGITGPPGAGKSTFAAAMAGELGGAVVAMDGFHLSNAELESRRLRGRKGSPATFDVDGFLARLEALRAGRAVRVPIYSRLLHEPIPDAVSIDAPLRFVIVEGNYLLLEEGRWGQVRRLLDGCWYLDAPLEVGLARVKARHMAGGLSEMEAETKIRDNDQPNAALVAATRPRADRVIEMIDAPGGGAFFR